MMGEVQQYMVRVNSFWGEYGDLCTGMFAFVAVMGAFYGAWVWARRFEKVISHTRDAMNFAYYSDLDRLYADILRLAIEKPHLRAPAPIVSDADVLARGYSPYPEVPVGEAADKLLQYESYAFLVWNFIETIRDRCADDPRLKETWGPVIGAENAIHRGWFLAQIRKEELTEREMKVKKLPYICADKFCVGFQAFVLDYQWQQATGRYGNWAYTTRFKDAAALRRTLAFE
jgi:hypothetical protein